MHEEPPARRFAVGSPSGWTGLLRRRESPEHEGSQRPSAAGAETLPAESARIPLSVEGLHDREAGSCGGDYGAERVFRLELDRPQVVTLALDGGLVFKSGKPADIEMALAQLTLNALALTLPRPPALPPPARAASLHLDELLAPQARR